jgi:phospholipase A-2-activating protein
MTDFHLVQSCVPHKSDIRAVLVVSEEILVTAGRDGNLMVHERDSSTASYRHVATGLGHDNFVSSLCLLRSPEGVALVLSASNDKSIALWSIPTSGYDEEVMSLVPQAIAKGHTDVVSCLTTATAIANGFVSGSWDHSVRLWSLETVATGADEDIVMACQAVMQGHTHSVWCLLELDDGSIVSGSADMSLRRWNVAETGHEASGVMTLGGCMHEHKSAHKAPVRALARVPLLGFVSTGNDGIVHLWTSMATGEFSVLRSFEAAPTTGTGYVYGLSLLPLSMEAVSCGEESWVAFHSLDSGDPSAQPLAVPGSAWCCATTPESADVIVGCSDGGFRVFSRRPETEASEAETAEYEAAIAKSIAERTRASGGMDLSKVKPASVALAAPATRDGETRMASEDGVAYAYSWRQSEGKWETIGEVEGPADETAHGGVERNGELNGVRYDYLFDVELDGRKMRLGHTKGENPYVSAQRFIHANDLGQDYLDEIGRWVGSQ